MTRDHLDADELGALLSGVRRASWRWECQHQYAVDADELNAWLAGEPVDPDEERPWLAYIRDLRARAIPFERARVLDTPRTTYQRWIFATTEANVAAGEDIRWLERTEASRHDMPGYDFYVLDEDRVAILDFATDGTLLGITVDDDPTTVATHLDYRSRVWKNAAPHREARL